MKKLFALLASGCLFLMSAASAPIGFVKSNGTFRVDGSTIRGNSTLIEGNVVETTDARSVLQIGSVQIALLPGSRAKVYRDHAVFEKGSGVASNADKYVIEASVLRIAPATKDSVVQVEMRGASSVAVAARTGSAEVRNASGVLVASVRPGEALAMDPQAGAAGAVKMTGIVESKDGKYFLTDCTTQVRVELQGPDVAKSLGKTVEITGSSIPGATPAAGASQLVQVATMRAASKAGCAGAPGAAGAAGAGGAAAGLSTGAAVAIVGGVVVGGTVIGLAAAGTFSGAALPASSK